MALPEPPEVEESLPAPSVTINNYSNTYSFGAFVLTTELESGTPNTKEQLNLSIKDEDGVAPAAGTLISARVWLIDDDGTLDPQNVAGDVFEETLLPPDTQPYGKVTRIVFIDGEATFTVEHSGSAQSWWVVLEINNYINLLGSYEVGT